MKLLTGFTALTLGVLALPSAVAAQHMPMSAKDLVTLPRLGEAAVSPDGSRVVYTVGATDPESFAKSATLFVRSLAGNAQPVRIDIDGKAASPQFGPDGSLYFLVTPKAPEGQDQKGDEDKPRAQLWRGTLTAEGVLRDLVQVTDVDGTIGGYALSPDGRRVALFGAMALTCESFGCDSAKAYAPGPGNGVLFRSADGATRNWASYETPGEYARTFVFELGPNGKASGGIAADGGTAIDSPLPPFGGKEDLAWSADGRTLYFAGTKPDALGDAAGNSDIYAFALDGAGPRNLTAANPAADGTPAVSPDGRSLAWLAASRPGHLGDRSRVLVRDLASGAERELAADFDRSFTSLTWTPDSRWLLASVADTLDTPLVRIDAASGAYQTLDLIAGNEAHLAAPIALPGNRLLFTRDSVGSPAELYLSTDWKQAKPITDVATSLVGTTASVVTRRFSFNGAEGETVWGQIHKPEGATGPLPAILYVHGGPHGSFGDAWSYRWNPRVLASQGYAVVSVDFHGSEGYGQQFTDSIRDDWGTKPLIDLQQGLKTALALDPQIDGTRACAMGASYGGYMMNWIAGNWPDRFQCLVNHAGVFDMRSMYYTTDIPAFLRWETGGKDPWVDIAGYDRRNPADYVANWKTPMLVVAGEHDFRVPYTQSIAAYNTLLARGIPGELLIFPEESHWVSDPKNSLQWHDTVFAWLDRWLKPG